MNEPGVRRRCCTPGFSLIELLVVIGVLSLLVAIALPVLGAARSAGRASVCLSNQKQTGLSLLAYTNDYDGRLVSFIDNTPATGATFWFGFEAGGPASGATGRPIDVTRSPLAPYQGQTILETLACPDFPAGDPAFIAKFAERSAHFGYNGGLCWPFIGSEPRAMIEVQDPSGVFAFADAVHQDFSNDEFYEPHTVSFRRPAKMTGTAHFRHPGGADGAANAVFLDGHGEALARPASETVWNTFGVSPIANLDVDDGPGTVYGFRTWTYP
ncbi:MAG: type II secretion system protein [Planctomycetota bacterium]